MEARNPPSIPELNMKSIRKVLWPALLTAGAVLSAAAGMSASAADDAAATPPAWHHRGGPWHLLAKLDLSAAQKQQIKDIMTAAKPQMQSLHEQMHANMQKLQQLQPTDPNYGSIVAQVSQAHGSLMAQAMTQQSEVRAQVFKVLTPAQQSQLTALEAEMRSHKHGGRGGPDAGGIPADQ
jgi:Spy/CpxP family protein refolding chaperone